MFLYPQTALVIRQAVWDHLITNPLSPLLKCSQFSRVLYAFYVQNV